MITFLYFSGPWWQSGHTLASHLTGRDSVPDMASSGKAGSCLLLVGSLRYRTLMNSMYWFPLPFQLPIVIWPVQCWKRRKTPNKFFIFQHIIPPIGCHKDFKIQWLISIGDSMNPRWCCGDTLASHCWVSCLNPHGTSSRNTCSCLPLVSGVLYSTLTNCIIILLYTGFFWLSNYPSQCNIYK